MPTPVVAKVFYTPECQRCHPIYRRLGEAQKLLGDKVRFMMFDISEPVEKKIAKSYGVKKIPSIVAYNEVFWVGIPDIEDLVKLLNHFYEHDGPTRDYMAELAGD